MTCMQHDLITEGEAFPPSLNSTFSTEDVSMDLTTSGLLVNRVERISQLYAEYLEWDRTKEVWHENRLGNRGSRESSQKIFHILKSRLQSSGTQLPSVKQLSTIFDLCENHRDKAQILYFYLIEGDVLVRYIIHEYVRQMLSTGDTEVNLKPGRINKLLEKFRFRDGSTMRYSKSTLARWGTGLRSVMREIDVLDSPRTVIGGRPPIGDIPLLVSAGYSWKKEGKGWLTLPIGWMYLFQPSEQWDALVKRLGEFNNWTVREVRGKIRMEPVNDPFNISRQEVKK